MRVAFVLVALVVLAACGGGPEGPTPPERPPPLAPLPPPKSTTSRQFADSIRCAQCHLASDDDTEALRDASGRDVSPVKLWRSSMMALAARDPFYLAAWNEERSRHPNLTEAIDGTCSRCHAPMASVETERALTFEDVVAGDTDIGHLARDGVSCALCHQIRDDNLGRESSFTGGFEIGFNRAVFGPHANPNVEPMEFFLEFTPTQSDHILQSEVCATCHTVVVEPVDDQGNPRGFTLVEQATYFEWLNSSYSDVQFEDAHTCGDCHLPITDVDDTAIRAPIAVNTILGGSLSPREPFGRHLFVGGGAYMSRLLAANSAWAGLELASDELEATAVASEAHLRTAAVIEVVSATRANGTATVAVKVENRTGHKLPTGYPTRRLWLHLVARDGGGQVVFESGSFDSSGAIVGDDPKRVRPHLDRVTDPSETIVWEAVMVDEDDVPTHRPLGAVAYGKDTRILPIGFSRFHDDYERMRPVGLGDDADFEGGADTVTFEIPAAGALELEIELLYQTLPPHVAAAHEEWPTPAGVRFAEMVAAMPPLPTSMAQATASVP